MSDENLGEVLDEGYRAHHREVAIRNLGMRTHLTLEQLAKLVVHKEHGETVKDITLQELIDVQTGEGSKAEAAAPAPATPRSSNKKAAKKSSKPAAAKKATAKKVAKKTTAKKAAKKATKKPAGAKGPKADKGKPKPRLNYEIGMREVLAAVKAAGEPVGRGANEDATGYSGVQVRTFAKRLKVAGKMQILGKGGRSTQYAMP